MASMADLGARLRSFSLEHPEADTIASLLRELAVDRPPAVTRAAGQRYRAQIDTPAGPKVLS
jgi:hypothetical protein